MIPLLLMACTGSGEPAGKSTPPTKLPAQDHATATPTAPAKKAIAERPTPPEGTWFSLVYQNNMDGEIEPCG